MNLKKLRCFVLGRSHKKWLEEQGLVDSIQKDMKKSQLCRLSTFSSGEEFFQHVVHEKCYESIVHLGLMHYLSILHEEETKPTRKHKRISAYHNI